MYIFLLIVLYYLLFLAFIANVRYEILTKIFVIALMVYLTFLIGVRYGVGIDYFTYEEWFHYWYKNITAEWIYSGLVFLLKTTSGEFYHLTLLMALLTNIYIYKGLTKRGVKNFYLVLAIMVFASSNLFVFANIMRQGLAIAIFFYSSTFIKERNKLKYFFYIIIGSGFHISMLFLIPFYYLNKINISLKNYITLIIISYFLVYTNFSSKIFQFIIGISPYDTKYFENNSIFTENPSVLSIGVLMRVCISIIILIFSNKLDKSLNIEKSYYQLGIIINILSISTYMFGRIGIYFQNFDVLMIPMLIKSIQNKNLRIIILVVIIFSITILMINELIINPEEGNLIYKSIFYK